LKQREFIIFRDVFDVVAIVVRAVARFFFVTGDIMASAEDRSLLGGPGGILPQIIFKFGGFETLFSALVMRYVSEKSTSKMKMANNCKSLLIIKITESKENKSIQRLDVSGLTGPAPLLATALVLA